MQLSVSDFFNLPDEQREALTSLNFWDQEEGIDEDLSLLNDNDFIRLCELLPSEQLNRLELCDNNVGNLAISRIEKLATTLAACSNLKILDLSNNNLYLLELASWIILAENLAKSNSLTTIILKNNQLGDLEPQLLKQIFETLAKINISSLNLAWNELGTNNALQLIIKQIANYPKLSNLNLSNNCLDLVNTTGLDVVGIGIGLSNNLEVLNIASNQLGRSEQTFIFLLQQASKAKVLNVADNQLHLLSKQLRFDHYQHLEVLNLADNDFSKITLPNFIALIDSLSYCKNLKELDLANTNLSALSSNDVDNLFDHLINNNSLINLSIAGNNLALSKSIPKLNTLLNQDKLTTLDLSDNLFNNLTELDWQCLLNGLAASYNLRSLNISSNELQLLSTNRIISLSATLKKCYQLENLNLSDQNFSVTDTHKLQILFTVLSELPNLRKLDISYTLSDCLVRAENMDVISQFIQSTTSLTTLKLEENISCESEQQLKEILNNKRSIRLKLK